MGYRVGVDVGGTFTDFLLLDDIGKRSWLLKTPSQPRDPAAAVVEGLLQLGQLAELSPNDITQIMHGTTVGTNTVLEERGAKVGLLCTEGFEQVLHLARGETPGPLAGWVAMIKPDPLARVEDTRGVRERVGSAGEVVIPIQDTQATAAIRELEARGVESIAISLMNSFANPVHERRLLALLTEALPGIPVSISSEVLPEFREYERTNVVVMNAYVQPKLGAYLAGLESRLRQHGIMAPVSVLRSDGGVMSVPTANSSPVNTLLSGPAGGVAGALAVARSSGYENFLSFDMGGTSTDVALCLESRPLLTRQTHLGYFPLNVPSIDVRSIGAGGGSIAHVPTLTKALRVGPASAGADPGPAAYGRGGTDATVTDANLVLGYLPPVLLGGSMQLDVASARAAVAKVADALGVGLEEAAEGIISIVNENMVGALRVVSVEKGYDPRDLALIAYGGAGPLHANSVAELIGSFPVVIPPTPGVLAALGAASSDFRREFSGAYIRRFDRTSREDVLEAFGELAQSAATWLADEAGAAVRGDVLYSADVRYHRQGYELTVEVDLDELLVSGVGAIARRFQEAHRREYGFELQVDCEFVNLRATAVGQLAKWVEHHSGDSVHEEARPIGTQRIYRGGRWQEASLFDRTALGCGHRLHGPAVILQQDSTTLVLEGFEAEVDDHANLVIQPSSTSRMTTRTESPIVVDIIESALKNIRAEQDAVIFRSAMSTVIREEHDSFPLLTDEKGRMLAGQFGWPLDQFFERFPPSDWHPGDVLMMNDPYLCGGAIQHTPDMLVLRPIFLDEELVGFASQFGNLMDIGGAVPGSMPTTSQSIFEEGVRFPPVKLYEGGKLVQPILDILARNSRTPDLVVADTLALAAATRAAELRVIELCRRFGLDVYRRTCQDLLDRTRDAAKVMIERFVPTTPLHFEDFIDDDGRGNGPFRIALSMWREGSRAILDFTGTSGQAEGPINLFMGEDMFKMEAGIVLIMAMDPDILFNHGFHALFEIRFPKASLVQPEFPAPLGQRNHTLARIFDVLWGALAQQNPAMGTGAACGTSPHFLFSGTLPSGEFFFYYEINYGGIPGRPVGDGLDVHAWWPHVTSIPAEYAEAYFPLRIERVSGRRDSGGAGRHRGGNGVEKVYRFLASGEVSIHDDRHRSRPWGIGGGRAAECSRKIVVRSDGTEHELPAKLDHLHVEPGDKLIYITAGGGGWGDPLERPPERVQLDVIRGFTSVGKAATEYGVILSSATNEVDVEATAQERKRLLARRPAAMPTFDFGRERYSTSPRDHSQERA